MGNERLFEPSFSPHQLLFPPLNSKAMSRIFGSLFLTAILFRDAFRHHKPLSYLLLLGVFLFLCFLYDIIRAVFDWLK